MELHPGPGGGKADGSPSDNHVGHRSNAKGQGMRDSSRAKLWKEAHDYWMLEMVRATMDQAGMEQEREKARKMHKG